MRKNFVKLWASIRQLFVGLGATFYYIGVLLFQAFRSVGKLLLKLIDKQKSKGKRIPKNYKPLNKKVENDWLGFSSPLLDKEKPSKKAKKDEDWLKW